MDPKQLSDKLSRQYMEALSSTIQLNGVPQIVQPYIVWDWGGNSYPLGSIPYQQVSALDLVPNDPVANSQTQTGAAGTGFGGNYMLFLNFINPTPQQTDPTYQGYQQQLTNDSRKPVHHSGERANRVQKLRPEISERRNLSELVGK